MRILIITPNYDPDLGPSAPLFTMLANGLAKRGHAITVITAVPHYPSGQVPRKYQGRLYWRSNEDGVNVIRVGLPSVRRKSLRQRLFQFVVFQISATLVGIAEQYDAVISANPALQVWLPFLWYVVLRRKPAIYSVHDVYPEVGIKLGIFKSKSEIALVSWLEQFCLNHASFVRILSDSFRPGLMSLNVDESKMTLVYDWVDTVLIQPMPHENQFSRQHNICDNFVVMYAGNIGLSQGLENILETAELQKGNPEIKFVFVGDGSGKETLKAQAELRKLSNVQFIPFQPRHLLPDVLASADISLVILKHDIGTASLPSKIFSIMASGRPILISIDEESEAWKLIKKADAGQWVAPENPSMMAESILNLKQNPNLRDRLGSNGRIWAEEHHSAQHAAEQFEKLLYEAVKLRKR